MTIVRPVYYAKQQNAKVALRHARGDFCVLFLKNAGY
jgi:hypothetical protein